MFGIGMPEMMVVLAVALIVIGPSKLPEIARTIGKGYAEFSKSMRQVQRSFSDVTAEFEEEARMLKDPIDTLSTVVENSFTDDEPTSPNPEPMKDTGAVEAKEETPAAPATDPEPGGAEETQKSA